MSVIGIDFGDGDCVIGQAKRGGIDILLNENSNRRSPNVVTFQGKQRFMGEAAAPMVKSQYKDSLYQLKGLLGRRFSDPDVQHEISFLPFRCVELPNGLVGVQVNYNDTQTVLSIERVMAMMLGHLKQLAENANPGVKVADAVVSVPGYYADSQRRMMLDACEIAGLNCLRLMNEHTAVALAYGIYKSQLFDEKKPEHVLFVDIGHSCASATVAGFVKGKLEIKGATYDHKLGGRNYTRILCDYFCELFREKTKKDLKSNKKAMVKLFQAAEKAKKTLSPVGVTVTGCSVECIMDDLDFDTQLTVEKLEELTADLTERVGDLIMSSIKMSKLSPEEITSVEIVGGGTRIPSIRRKIATLMNLDQSAQNFGLSTTLNADESVGRGCALQCAILSPLFRVKDFAVVDKALYPISVAWDQDDIAGANDEAEDADAAEEGADVAMNESEGKNSTVLFRRGDEFPRSRRITFKRKESFKIYASYADEAVEDLPTGLITDIGEYNVVNVEKELASSEEVPKIRVNVRQDIHGIFSVSSAQMMLPIAAKAEAPTDAVEAKEGEGKNKEGDAEMTDKPEEGSENKGEKEGKQDEAATAKSEEPAAKKKFKKVDLRVEAVPASGMSREEKIDAVEEEGKMQQQDRIIRETADMRNELEAYVYQMRDRVSYALRDFVAESDRQKFEEKLTSMEDWLYTDEGFDAVKTVYSKQLQDLKKIGDPIEFRYNESTERKAAADELTSFLEELEGKVNSGCSDPAMDHLSDEEWARVRKEIEDARAWMYDQLATQSAKPTTEDPVVTSSQLREKRLSVMKNVAPILNKPRPKPKVEEKPAEEPNKEEKKADENEKAGQSGENATDVDAKTEDAMDTDSVEKKEDVAEDKEDKPVDMETD